jgi:hypothetical protein
MWRRLAPLALLALILVGCDPLPASFSAVFPETNEAAAFPLAEEPVYVYDASGTVTGIAITDADMSSLGGQGTGRIEGDVLILEWIGGACESRVYIIVALDAEAYRARIHPETSLLGMLGCPALGIGRAVRLQLREPPQTRRAVTHVDSY